MSRRLLLFIVFLVPTTLPTRLLAAPNVVVTLAPIHSLASRLMEGIGEPSLLLPPNSSPHTYSLRPSDMRKLHDADLVVRVSPELERFLERPLQEIDPTHRLDLITTPGLPLLQYRSGGRWEKHSHGTEVLGEESEAHDHDHDHEENEQDTGHTESEGMVDAHIWQDPQVASQLAAAIATRLGQLDPDNNDRYAANLHTLQHDLAQLDEELTRQLTDVRHVPYLVFHDAFHYLERRYGLNARGSVVIDLDRRPGAKRLAELRGVLREGGARCLFGEPGANRSLVEMLLEGTGIGYAELDPVGSTQQVGPGLYFAMQRGNAAALNRCLKP